VSGNPNKSLETLAEIKSIEERAAAERLSGARERFEEERQKLTTVRRYLLEYAEPASDTGRHTRLLVDRQRFRLELERSAEAQVVAVERARVQAETAREHWAGVRAEREAMRKLVERREADATRKSVRADQRQSDELALGRAGKGDRSAAGSVAAPSDWHAVCNIPCQMNIETPAVQCP
jgi:flagellar export protein FliJ